MPLLVAVRVLHLRLPLRTVANGRHGKDSIMIFTMSLIAKTCSISWFGGYVNEVKPKLKRDASSCNRTFDNGGEAGE